MSTTGMVSQEFIQLSLEIPLEHFDTAVAVLSELGFYAFEETPSALEAFVLPGDYDEAAVNAAFSQFFPELEIGQSIQRIAAKDWNAEWESNFQSVFVRDFCEVRPPFRERSKGISHHVIVAPKMAFGTGHHATTWLMIEHCSHLEFPGKRVLDMGCGTGVLGILASKLGAAHVTCIDFDPWSRENTQENANLNGQEVEVILGDATAIPAECYEIILANINRNVLIADRDRYIAALAPGGILVMSGFYDFDETTLLACYAEGGMRPLERKEKDKWLLLAFERKK